MKGTRFALTSLVYLITCSVLTISSSLHASEKSTTSVTLLLPGMQFDLKDPTLSFGTARKTKKGMRWNGLIGALNSSGHRFGGVVRPRGADLSLPRCLDKKGVVGDPRKAKLFALDYSSSANVDGLAYKTLELAACLESLRKYTGCDKVRIVAFSAGGLVARVYLQSALPKVAYEGDIDRLITIATPHLGSTKAEHWGDFLGTRASCLKPSSELVRRLNDDLELPRDVRYASVVVRGVKVGVTGLQDKKQDLFERFVDEKFLSNLPLDYQKGSDQIVNVWSQNLAATNAARKYEAAHKRPVQFVLARVDDPTPSDWVPYDTSVHEVAPCDGSVINLVKSLLCDGAECWDGLGRKSRSRTIQRHASNCAYGIVEDAMSQRHRYSEVYDTNIKRHATMRF